MQGRFRRRKWVKLFTMYNINNAGVLKRSDFETFVGTLAKIKGWESDAAEYHQLSNEFMNRWTHIKTTIQGSATTHHIDEINLENWVKYHKSMLDESDQYQNEINAFAQIIFDICDVDESGNLDLQEWVTLFSAFRLPVVYAPEAFSCLDQNGDGLLQKNEVVIAVNEFYYSDDPGTPANFMFGPY